MFTDKKSALFAYAKIISLMNPELFIWTGRRETLHVWATSMSQFFSQLVSHLTILYKKYPRCLVALLPVRTLTFPLNLAHLDIIVIYFLLLHAYTPIDPGTELIIRAQMCTNINLKNYNSHTFKAYYVHRYTQNTV